MKRQRTGLRRTAGGLVSFDLHHKSAKVTIKCLNLYLRFIERMTDGFPSQNQFLAAWAPEKERQECSKKLKKYKTNKVT
jgi:hypothetical protein